VICTSLLPCADGEDEIEYSLGVIGSRMAITLSREVSAARGIMIEHFSDQVLQKAVHFL
jgi:hypothetical protein